MVVPFVRPDIICGEVADTMKVPYTPLVVPYLMDDDVAPVPTLQLMVACVLPATADIALGAAGGGEDGIILYSELHVVPTAFLAPT